MTEQSASEWAAATGESVEVTGERTEYTTTVANPDGTFTLTQSTEPQRARAADGAWRDVDITLEKRSDGTVAPKAAVVDLSFSGGGSGSELVQMGRDGKELKLGWPTSLPAPNSGRPHRHLRQRADQRRGPADDSHRRGLPRGAGGQDT